MDGRRSHYNNILSEAYKTLGYLSADCTAGGQREPKVRYAIRKKGRERKRLQALAAELGIEQHVPFLGHRNNMYDVLQALDLLVITSDHEGLPMVLLEALALGIPVVARRVGGIPEVITNNVTGILVESNSPTVLAKACEETLANTALCLRLREAGRSMVRETFSADRTARRVADLYRSLLSAQ